MLRATTIAALSTTALLLAGTAAATPAITFDVVGGSGATAINESGTIADPAAEVLTWTLDAPLQVEGVTINSWSSQLKVDPFVTNNINVTNTTAFTQTFVATVLLPIPSFNYTSVISSSVGITVTDSNGNGVMSFAQNGVTPIYQGTVNGTSLLDLTPPDVPLEVADCSPFPAAGCSATDADGVAFLAVTPGAATSIGITLTFDLSPGDSAGLTSRFEIVPEPSTALLVAGGFLVLGGARRRR